MIVKAKSRDTMLRVLVVENLLSKMPALAKCFALVILVNQIYNNLCHSVFFIRLAYRNHQR